MTDSRLDPIGPGACNPSSRKSEIITKLWWPTYFVNGAHLRARRECLGIGLRELAKKLKVSATYLSRIELSRDETKVSASFAMRIEAWGDSNQNAETDGR